MSLACGRTLGQFALVSYLPEPLGSFLDRLRLDLDPGCKPHAHVTILPPRPFTDDLGHAIEHLKDEGRLFPPIDIQLGDVEIFPVSNVIFIGLAKGVRGVRKLHDVLDTGGLHYDCPFAFHPHITIGQDLKPECVREAARIAREKWAAYDGPRSFVVDSLSFVQNVAPGLWIDLARVPLASPVSAGT
ncbi:MAG: 2'-5' RNA ligase family protein [Acidobacteriota bacterium]